ncbi:MAG: asparagine synthase (glutamine-hydrolyzing) [Kordia sp.]|nr:MAG: asparagine synthase (glutamine-hydrolyzing) [Kordia sp.]
MCGILFYHSLNKQVDHLRFTKALNTLKHRGPDGQGVWISPNGNVGLGHTRLQINGGELGAQPLFSKGTSGNDKNWVAVVNGEIYNSREALLKKGVQFTTQSDSEILLQQFIHEGIEGLNTLSGEFVFSLWNEETKTAYIGRDRHGIKPIYYIVHDQQLIAASEIKALLEYGVPRRWNQDYLANSAYFVQDANETFVDGVFALPPGYCLKINQKGIEQISYISKSPLKPFEYKTIDISFTEACSQFNTLLREAIHKRLDTNNTTSCYLSSGIDSSIITAIAAQKCDGLTAYSIAFEEAQLDESTIARAFSHKIGVEHHTVQVNDQILADNFIDAVYHSEMAVPNINIAAKYHLSKVLKAQNKKVVLTGEGADESLLGYGFFRQDLTAPYRNFQQIPDRLKPSLSTVFNHLGFAPAQILHAAGQGNLLHSLRQQPINGSATRYTNLMHQLDVQSTPIKLAQELHYKSVFQTYNLGALADRTEMANSVEGRPPFLDNDLVAFIHSLPENYKFHEGTDKLILREVAKKYMPTNHATIQKKPFIAAASSLKSKGPLADLFKSYLLEGTFLPSVYSKTKVQELYQQVLQLPVHKQSSFDPVFVHLTSLMILQERFSLS